MKSLKKLFCVLFVAIVAIYMFACGNPTRETGICTYEGVGVVITITMEAESDIVKKMTQTSTMDKSQYTDDQVLEIYTASDNAAVVYNSIDGVKYSMEEKGGKIVETIIMDVSDGDTLKALVENGMLPVQGSTSAISLNKTLESLESQGWVTEKK